MKHRDYTALLATMAKEYENRSPRSAALHQQALRSLVDGGSHTIRLMRPFPPRITAAQGAYVTDEDGHRILDFWQGHYANILGHNPAVITEVMSRAFGSGTGLQTGFTDALQVHAAELLAGRVGAERVRFTSSGSLATMYATFLSRGFTGRETVMKVGGGWHGAQPWGLVGVDYHAERAHKSAPLRGSAGGAAGFKQQESRGLPHGVAEEVIVTRFNDTAMLEKLFARHGKRIACFIFEPFLGSGGCLPATREFLEAARSLTTRYGALLVFDEVISGFRFCAGSIARLFGVQPDLATYAKVMGGGMPVAAVAGKADVMKLAGRGGSVKFSGRNVLLPSCLDDRLFGDDGAPGGARGGGVPARQRPCGEGTPGNRTGVRRFGDHRALHGKGQQRHPRKLPRLPAFALRPCDPVRFTRADAQSRRVRRRAFRHGAAAGPFAGGCLRHARLWRGEHRAHAGRYRQAGRSMPARGEEDCSCILRGHSESGGAWKRNTPCGNAHLVQLNCW